MSKTSNVKIISDGTPGGTKVLVDDGVMQGVCKIEIDEMSPGNTVTAKITVFMPELEMRLADAEIVCTDPCTEHKIKEALIKYSGKE